MIKFNHALVTGSSGFIGKKFLKLLISNNPEMLVSAGNRTIPIEENAGRKINYFHLDLSTFINFEISPDIVFHIAGEVNDENVMDKVNYEGTKRIVDFSITKGVKRFVYLSTVGVYGADKKSGSIDESFLPSPKNKYEQTKHDAEMYVQYVCKKNNIDYVILQPSTVLGITDDGNHLLINLIKMIKRGLFTYFDAGNGYFNYVSVEDVASALVSSMSKEFTNQKFILNDPFQILSVANWIAQELGIPKPSRRCPYIIGLIAAELFRFVTLISGIKMPFNRERFTELTSKRLYDNRSILTKTNFVYSFGLERTVKKLVNFYRDSKLI